MTRDRDDIAERLHDVYHAGCGIEWTAECPQPKWENVGATRADWLRMADEVVALVAEREQAATPNRDHLAAAIMYGRDTQPDDVRWRWDATVERAKSGHYGDCTKRPVRCAVCQIEEALEEADAVIATLRALAAPPQPERTP